MTAMAFDLNLAKRFLTSAIAFLVLDLVWLGYVMKSFNAQQLQHIGRIVDGQFDIWLPPAVIVYILMAFLVAAFLIPSTSGMSALGTMGWGCLMGLCVYGVFDMTNAAILKDYPMKFAVVDMAWGTFAFGAVGWIVRRVHG
jgi:uncharacterized membrane protein